MYYLIYKITNTVNNKIYIGKHQTNNKNDDYMGSGKILKKAIEKYGIDKFKKEILFECNSLEEMNEKEADIVDEEFVARLDTYNVKLGGQGGWDYCNNNHEMQSQKAKNNWLKYGLNHPALVAYRDYRQKIINDDELREEISKKITNKLKLYYKYHDGTFFGKKHTEESKRKIGLANSIRQRGELNSHYGTCWIYNEELKRSIRIKKEELDGWLKDGWKKGRKIKF